MGPCAAVAVFHCVTTGSLGIPDAEPLEKERMRLRKIVRERHNHECPVPEILFLVVLGKPRAHRAALADVEGHVVTVIARTHEKIDADLARFRHTEEFGEEASRHLDDAHDARGDFGDTDALRVAGWKEDLESLGTSHRASQTAGGPL